MGFLTPEVVSPVFLRDHSDEPLVAVVGALAGVGVELVDGLQERLGRDAGRLG